MEGKELKYTAEKVAVAESDGLKSTEAKRPRLRGLYNNDDVYDTEDEEMQD